MYGGSEAYRSAVEINQKDYRAWYGLGQAYELLGLPYYALHYFRRATQVRPLRSQSWKLEQSVLEEPKNWISIMPEFYVKLSVKGKTFLERKDFVERRIFVHLKAGLTSSVL